MPFEELVLPVVLLSINNVASLTLLNANNVRYLLLIFKQSNYGFHKRIFHCRSGYFNSFLTQKLGTLTRSLIANAICL